MARIEGADDSWLDVPRTAAVRRRDKILAWIGQPIQWFSSAAEFSRTTPGIMVVATLLVSILVLLGGVVTLNSTTDRRAAYQELAQTAEPASYSAHNMYTSLALTDTLAVTGLAEFSSSSRDVKTAYVDPLNKATLAGTETAANATGPGELAAVARVNQNLPTYAGLVMTARMNVRAGNPIGSAYMAQANSLMREQLLPAAGEVFTSSTQRVQRQLTDLTKPQWWSIGLLGLSFVGLVLVQLWLARRTRRRLNAGFLTANVLVALALVWLGGGNVVAWRAASVGAQEAAAPYTALTDARIEAQQARTAETLALVRRGAGNEASISFTEATDRVDAAITQFDHSRLNTPGRDEAAAARAALYYWESVHGDFVAALERGDYEASTRLALAPGNSTGEAFTALDSSLTTLIDASRAGTRSYISQGLRSTTGTGLGVLSLSLFAIVAVWLGIRPRLQEYL
ncbi:hypothetical protein [Corynebacterium pyruviciproducens]|uniref:hypothetical protein n=1 Tax=Corynebacterium pyruviciproducens TaxID=598660 RepID=UPI0023F42D06|nr:hypothetical protein [Corynebacterium pyruviciproducens]